MTTSDLIDETAHDWGRHPVITSGDVCFKCGIVRRADDKNKPCKGIVYVGLRKKDGPQ